MDPKNQNLKPELKEIYDKIMSTPTSNGTSTTTPKEPNPTVQVNPQPTSISSTPPPPPTMESIETMSPAMPSTPASPSTAQAASVSNLNPQSFPQTPPPPPSLDNNPTPPINTPIGMTDNLGGGYAFSGGQTTSFTPTGAQDITSKKGLGKISGKLLTLLIVAFIITYTIIWLKLFNFF